MPWNIIALIRTDPIAHTQMCLNKTTSSSPYPSDPHLLVYRIYSRSYNSLS